jgi:hypothetical protein
MDVTKSITSALMQCLKKSGGNPAKIDRSLTPASDYIYDSVDQDICESSFFVLTGTIEVEVYCLTDTVDGKHKPATYKHSVKCINSGDFLFEDTINSLKLMNLEVRVRGLGGRDGVDVVDFKYPLFMQEIIKQNHGDLIEYLFTRITRSMADFYANDYHAQYRPARNSDYIKGNNSVTLMLAEYLKSAIISSEEDGWAPFIMPTTELRVRTKLPNKSIASYRGILEDAGYIKFTGLSTNLINLKKSFTLLQDRPIGSRATANKLETIYSNTFFSDIVSDHTAK